MVYCELHNVYSDKSHYNGEVVSLSTHSRYRESGMSLPFVSGTLIPMIPAANESAANRIYGKSGT